MNILTLDLATMTGYALGHPPDEPSGLRSGQFSVAPQPSIDETVEDLAQRALNLEAFLLDIFAFKAAFPDMVVYEAPRDPNAKVQDERGQTDRMGGSIILPFILAAKVVEFCKVRGVRYEKVYPISWQTTFVGKASDRKGQNVKKLVLKRCEDEGYLPPRTPFVQNNRADAIGMWFWAQIRFGGWRPSTEIIMGQKVAMVRP